MLKEFGVRIASWTLVPGAGGVFDVDADGQRLYSKHETGRHAAHEEIRAALAAQLGDEPGS